MNIDCAKSSSPTLKMANRQVVQVAGEILKLFSQHVLHHVDARWLKIEIHTFIVSFESHSHAEETEPLFLHEQDRDFFMKSWWKTSETLRYDFANNWTLRRT